MHSDDIEKQLSKYFPALWTEKDIKYYLKRIEHKIDKNALNQNLNTPIRDFVLRGGKRLRPILFLITLKLFGKKPQKYLDLAVAIEIIHNATLVLDDIEDEALLRRGKLACHRKFGLDTATNVGMSMHILPLRIILSNHNELSSIQKLKLINVYTDELINVSFGQALDIYWHKNTKTNKFTVEKYLEMVRLKTGSLMRMSFRSACVIAGKSQKTENLFTKFAESLGMAFQIIDDSLDLRRPSKKFGKAFGNDITEGKISLPVVYTLETVSKRNKARLLEILEKHTSNKKLILEAVKIIEDSGSIEKSVLYAKHIINDAWSALEKKWRNGENLSELEKVTNFLTERTY